MTLHSLYHSVRKNFFSNVMLHRLLTKSAILMPMAKNYVRGLQPGKGVFFYKFVMWSRIIANSSV